MERNFKDTLKLEASKIGLELDKVALNRFEKYKNLLLEWNEKINLTAITDEYEIIIKHFVDCLEIVKQIKTNQSIIDVGTGAGFPGIVIAIYFNDTVNITLLDALNKRLLFLEEVVKCLNLKNINIVHGRAEEKAKELEFKSKYDIVVSRAVANLPVLLELDSGFLKISGKCLLMKGDTVDEEIKMAQNAFKILHLELSDVIKYQLCLFEECYQRSIVIVEKKQEIPNKYPRIYGKIKKNPL